MDNCILDSIGTARRTFCALVGVLSIGLAPGLAAAENENLGTSKEGGIGASAALASLVYSPTKLVFALGGLVSTGLAWMFSGGDSEVASTVLTRSVRGARSRSAPRSRQHPTAGSGTAAKIGAAVESGPAAASGPCGALLVAGGAENLDSAA